MLYQITIGVQTLRTQDTSDLRHFGPIKIQTQDTCPDACTGKQSEYLHRRPVALHIMQRPIREYQKGYKPLELNLKLLLWRRTSITGI